jgi:molybdopterin/thiamine biosynthesis adenylyltransferase
MKKTYYAFVPLVLKDTFAQAVALWETENNARAYISPAYSLCDCALNQQKHTINDRSFADTVLLFDGKVQSCVGFCFVFDEGQISPELQSNIIDAGGAVFTDANALIIHTANLNQTEQPNQT